MIFNFPIDDVKITIAAKKKLVEAPLFEDGFFRVNQYEFSIDVQGVAFYYVTRGKTILITPYAGAEKLKIELFLYKWGLVSILHQRKILNFHASSFSLDGRGVMICGDSGAGKSSITAAFSLGGAKFISDDVSAVVFSDGSPQILNISNRLALKKKALLQLDIGSMCPAEVKPVYEKYILKFPGLHKVFFPLSQIFWIHIHDNGELKFREIKGLEKFSMLRGEICAWEILKGMRETEAAYMQQLINISQYIRITEVLRPSKCTIKEMTDAIGDYLKKDHTEMNEA